MATNLEDSQKAFQQSLLQAKADLTKVESLISKMKAAGIKTTDLEQKARLLKAKTERLGKIL